MNIQIKNRYTEKVIYETEAKTIKEAVEKAIKEKVDLSEADLSEADLSEADLIKKLNAVAIPKKEHDELQEAFDIALLENNRLRGLLRISIPKDVLLEKIAELKANFTIWTKESWIKELTDLLGEGKEWYSEEEFKKRHKLGESEEEEAKRG